MSLETDPPERPDAYDAVVGANRQYETIQDAIRDDAQSILVATNYDPTGESYPVTITADRDGRWTPTTIHGVGPNAVTVGDPDQEADTIQIHGNGNHYGRPVQITDLALASHPDATVVKAACLSSGLLENVIVEDSGTAVALSSSYIEDYVGGCFDWVIRDTDIWRCRNGVRIDGGAAAHNVLLEKVDVTACDGAGVYAEDCAAVTFRDGTVQLNHGFGFELRNTINTTIDSAYVEGNARSRDFPVEVYGDHANGLTIRDSYFHGINPRGANHEYDRVQRAVNLHDSDGAAVRDCDARRYGTSFAVSFGNDLICDNIRLSDDTILSDVADNIVEPVYE